MPKSREDEVVIEKSPSYFRVKMVPKRIYNLNKNMKLILLIRNPVKRVLSDYHQTLAKGLLSKFWNGTHKVYQTPERALFHTKQSSKTEVRQVKI